jgi:predicted enzyme related to lactoylglutathione lyase
MHLNYAIKFVGDMDKAVAFYRDTLGLKLKWASPFWSEFETGDTSLALHPASDENRAGNVQLGLRVDDFDAFIADAEAKGIAITSPPREVHGTRIARFRDCEGAEVSVSEVRG